MPNKKRKTVKKTAKKSAVKVARKAKRKKRPVKKVVTKAKKSFLKIKVQKPVGAVTHYYNHIKVGIVKFSKPVKLGTLVRFEGATTDFKQKLSSMQYDHKDLKVAPKGKQVGLKVVKRVREGDQLFEI